MTGGDRLAAVHRDDDGWVVVFERDFAHPREKVWRALTESDHLRHWFPCDIIGPRETGAALTLPFWPAHVERYSIAEPVLDGEIRVWDPPSVFEWTWSTDVLRWELDETDIGTHLTFTTRIGPDDQGAANTAAGYHVCIATLEQLLDEGGAPPLIDADVSPFETAYAELIHHHR